MVVLPWGIISLLGGVARMNGGVAMVMVGVASRIGCGHSCLILLHHLEVGSKVLVIHQVLYIMYKSKQ